MSKKEMVVFHPDSPGVRVVVRRNWIQRLLFPKHFATLIEAIKADKQDHTFSII